MHQLNRVSSVDRTFKSSDNVVMTQKGLALNICQMALILCKVIVHL